MRSKSPKRNETSDNKRPYQGLTILSLRLIEDASIKPLPKFSAPPLVQITSQEHHNLDPLRAHSSPESSTSAEPQLTSPPSTTAPLHITKTRLDHSTPQKANVSPNERRVRRSFSAKRKVACRLDEALPHESSVVVLQRDRGEVRSKLYDRFSA
jgi:hypothetical protein